MNDRCPDCGSELTTGGCANWQCPSRRRIVQAPTIAAPRLLEQNPRCPECGGELRCLACEEAFLKKKIGEAVVEVLRRKEEEEKRTGRADLDR